MIKKYSELEMWDVILHNGEQYVVIYSNKLYTPEIRHITTGQLMPLALLSYYENNVIGKMRIGPTDEEIAQENKEIHKSWLQWCEEKGQWP